MKSFSGRVVLVMLILALGWICLQLAGYARLQYRMKSRVADLRASGQPVNIADLERTDLLESEAVGRLVELNPVLNDLQRVMFAFDPASNGSAKEDEARHLAFQTFTVQHPSVIGQVRDAASLPLGKSRCDYGASPAVNFLDSAMDQMHHYQLAVRSLSHDADFRMHEGNPDEATRDAIAILRWADHITTEPGLMFYQTHLALRSQGISIAARAIATQRVSDELQQEVIAMISDHDPTAAIVAAFASERAIGLSLSNDLGVSGMMPMMIESKLQYLDLMQDYLEQANNPWGLPKPQAANLTGVFSALVDPALAAASKRFRSNQASKNALRLMHRWLQSDKTMLPEIDKLPIESASKIDPFTGESMRSANVNENVSFYSVGANLQDDQGNFVDEIDIGFSCEMAD